METSTKPASQLGSRIALNSTKGLATGLTSENILIHTLDKPLFIDALIATIFVKPIILRCS